jgi:sugar O-acyltransferase (sialic acid O-acetyltransferase NeuD family)
MRSIVIVGAGGFGRETASLLEALRPEVDALGFLDDSPELAGGKVAGLPVLGTVDEAPAFADARFVVTAGSPRRFDVKRVIVERLGLDHARYAVLVHPAATIGTEVEIGEGTVVFAGTVATHAVTIGRHVGIMPNVVLTHDDVVGDYAILGAGALLAGGVTVGEGAYIGAGARIREGITVGAGAMVGMGSVVLDDVPAGETWIGAPAHRLR